MVNGNWRNAWYSPDISCSASYDETQRPFSIKRKYRTGKRISDNIWTVPWSSEGRRTWLFFRDWSGKKQGNRGNFKRPNIDQICEKDKSSKSNAGRNILWKRVAGIDYRWNSKTGKSVWGKTDGYTGTAKTLLRRCRLWRIRWRDRSRAGRKICINWTRKSSVRLGCSGWYFAELFFSFRGKSGTLWKA